MSLWGRENVCRVSVKHLLVCLSLCSLLSGCGVLVRSVGNLSKQVAPNDAYEAPQKEDLQEKEKSWIKIAWTYFVNNSKNPIHVSNSLDEIPTVTMASVADYLVAILAAYYFELIGKKEFDVRFTDLLDFLHNMPLFENRVPNRIYSTQSGKMLDFFLNEKPVGWSSIDIGRLLVWLRIATFWHPEFHEYIDKAIFRWNFCDLIDENGNMYAGLFDESNRLVTIFQEGRLGYEEYAAQGFRAWGFNTSQAESIEPYEIITINGVDILHDGRDPRVDRVLSPVLSTPHFLFGIELDWRNTDKTSQVAVPGFGSSVFRTSAEQVYLAQKRRYSLEKIFTARGEHYLNQSPYFLYDSVFANGYLWNTVSDDGLSYPDLSLVSTKVAFMMRALWPDEYTRAMMVIVEELYEADKGWYEGRYEVSGIYEKTFSSSTNAIVLESMLFREIGAFFKPTFVMRHAEIRLKNEFKHPGRCFPSMYAGDVDRKPANEDSPGLIKATPVEQSDLLSPTIKVRSVLN